MKSIKLFIGAIKVAGGILAILTAGVCVVAMAVGFYNIPSWNNGRQNTEKEIILAARRASVQPLFYVPMMKASFAKPLEQEKKIETVEDLKRYLEEQGIDKEGINKLLEDRNLTKDKLDKLIDQKIKATLEAEKIKESTEKYDSTLTTIEKYGYKAPSKTYVPLGAFCPSWAKFPQKVLVVYKTEKAEIQSYDKKYEKDILAISELANVSPTTAQNIITRLRSEGYSVSKEKVDVESEVKLLWFQNGWNSGYPTELSWSVSLSGEKGNIITEYDPRGILEVRTIPEGKTVDVIAGFFDLKPEYKPKSDTVKTLQDEIEKMENRLREKDDAIQLGEQELAKKTKELDKVKEELNKAEGVITKRDITKATWADVQYGLVKAEEFWVIEGGTGTYLGDMKVSKNFSGYAHSLGGFFHNIEGEKKSIILTNAHVAETAKRFEVWVSEDKEVMWIVYPGIPYVRFTQDSDMWGTPAQLLCYNSQPILSHDYDTAILVTTKIPGFDQYKAKLGNSDLVKQGDSVVIVGNPSLLQKFATQGIVSNKDYNFLKNQTWHWFPKDIPHSLINMWVNCSLWYDAPAVIGGTSGSGVWALDGTEKGNVIALNALGLRQPLSIAKSSTDGVVFDVSTLDKSLIGEKCFDMEGSICPVIESKKIKDTAKDLFSVLFKSYSHKDAKFQFSFDDLSNDDDSFKKMMQETGQWVPVAGMSAGIPINKVKMFLQERGLDPELFGSERLDASHWEK